MHVFEILAEYRWAYVAGLMGTLKLCGVAWLGGLVGGSAIALGAEWYPRLIQRPALALRWVTEAVPILVLLFWLHYPLQAALGVTISPFVTTAALLTVLNALAVFSILTEAIAGIPREFVEVARVSGVARRRMFWLIKVPLALRPALGPLTSAQVNVLQLSIFGGLISVEELFRVSQRINALVYRPVEVYTGLALFFVVVCLPLNVAALRLRRRLRVSLL
jgi:ABC-type amino acid transport system permease subunit